MPGYVAVYELLLQVSLAGCVLLGVATVAVVLLREPARQIRVIELAMWGLLALPLVVLIPGYPRVALLPASEVASEEPAPVNVASFVQPPALPGGPATIDPPLPPVAELPPPRATTSPRTSTPPLASTPPLSTPPLAPTIDVASRESSTAPLPTPVWQFPTDYRLWIVSSYLASVGILLAWSLVGFVALCRLVRSSRPADTATRSALHAIAGDTSARVRLLVSSRAAQPCAFGWMRPTIVLPQSLVDSGDPAALRFALAHEWSHVSRGDVGVWTISGFARLLHFQQPFVWLLRQHLRRAQDYLADAAAAGAGTPEDYAEFLTSFSQSFKRPRLAPGLGIVSRRSDLHRRVVMLVEKQGSLERTPPRRWNAAILIAGLLAVAAVASLRAEPKQATEQQPLSSATPDLDKPTSDDGIPKELHPERIRDTARQYDLIELVVQSDPQLKELRQQLDELVRQANTVPMESTTPPGDRTPRYRIPNTEPYTRIAQLEQRVSQREAEVRVAAQKSLAVNPDGNDTDHVLKVLLNLDPVIEQLDKALRNAQKEAKERKNNPDRYAEWQQLIRNLGNERDRRFKFLEDTIKQRNAALGGALPEAQTQRFMPGDDGLAQNRPASTTRRTPFSGKIRPGDRLQIEIVGGLPQENNPPRTVEPDGNVVIGAAYGTLSRMQVGGMTLIEAGKHIENELRDVLKKPQVLVTYVGHDPDVISVDKAAESASASIPIAREAEAELEPLDTIQIRLGTKTQTLDSLNGTYLIEPDGRVALAGYLGRIKLAGLTESQAGDAVRAHISTRPGQRKAPPSINIVRRGRAVFSKDKQPAADYRVRPGDHLLVNQEYSPADGRSFEITKDGMFQTHPEATAPQQEPVDVAGLTLEEVQRALDEKWKAFSFFEGRGAQASNVPWIVTLGGWHEEADPQLIDRLGESNDPRVQQLERELQQIKTLLREQH